MAALVGPVQWRYMHWNEYGEEKNNLNWADKGTQRRKKINLLYRHDKPNKRTKVVRLSSVLMESPFHLSINSQQKPPLSRHSGLVFAWISQKIRVLYLTFSTICEKKTNQKLYAHPRLTVTKNDVKKYQNSLKHQLWRLLTTSPLRCEVNDLWIEYWKNWMDSKADWRS
jgi:hypothetical protein